ncbi:hypothetical protein EBT16_04665 [bacterium]|nr:hypothetical protein [bacterium]
MPAFPVSTIIEFVKPIEQKIRRLHYFQLGSALLGIVLSLYLLVHHTRVKLGIQDSSSFCSFGRLADCDIVNVSKFSEVSGMPLASIGAIYFFFLFVSGIFFPPKNPTFRLMNRFLAWLSSLALLIDLVLLIGVQWLTLGSFCLVCILTYFANLGHLVANYRTIKLEHKTHPIQNLFWGRGPWSLKGFSVSKVFIALTSTAVFSAMIVFLPSWMEMKEGQSSPKKDSAAIFFSKWSQIPVQEISTSPKDGVYGNQDAKVKMVIFSDFQCPFCKKTAFGLHTLLPSFKNELLVVFKHFPLDKTCNPLVEHNMHPYACSLARLAVCANQKGKFWEYHDLVFMHLDEQQLEEGWDVVRKKLAPVFQSAEIDECLRSESSLDQVKQDIDLGIRLGIQGTPAIFINGKSVTVPLDLETIKKVLALENPQK